MDTSYANTNTNTDTDTIPPSSTSTPIQISTLNSSSAATNPELLDSILSLSNQVFEIDPTRNKTPHSDLSTWRSRLSQPQSLIIYATIGTTTVETKEDSTSTSTPRIIGFFFTYPKLQPEIGLPGLHVWLAAVHHSARGRGVFSRLLEETKRHAIDCGLELVTVVTVPRRFGRMYEILRRGSGGGGGSRDWEFVAWRDSVEGETMTSKNGDGTGGVSDKDSKGEEIKREKVLMKLRI